MVFIYTKLNNDLGSLCASVYVYCCIAFVRKYANGIN